MTVNIFWASLVKIPYIRRAVVVAHCSTSPRTDMTSARHSDISPVLFFVRLLLMPIENTISSI